MFSNRCPCKIMPRYKVSVIASFSVYVLAISKYFRLLFCRFRLKWMVFKREGSKDSLIIDSAGVSGFWMVMGVLDPWVFL